MRQIIRTTKELEEFGEKVFWSKEIDVIAVDIETTEFSDATRSPLQMELYWIWMYAAEELQCYIQHSSEMDYTMFNQIVSIFPIVLHNAKFDLTVLVNLKILFFPDDMKQVHDTMLMSYIEDSDRMSHWLKQLSKSILGIEDITKYSDVGKRPENKNIWTLFVRDNSQHEENVKKREVTMAEYCMDDCLHTYRLYKHFKKLLDEDPALRKLYIELEVPFMWVLFDMENRWVKIDLAYLKEMEGVVEDRLVTVGAEIYRTAWKHFDINSPKQLKEIFYEQMKYKATDDMKSNSWWLSTDSAVLEYFVKTYDCKLSWQILDYRELSKLQSTYIKGMQKLALNWNIHCSFNQIGARTGRISCIHKDTVLETNLGNIKISDLPLCLEQNPYITSGKQNAQKITKVIYKGKSGMLKLKTKEWNEIVCTGEHKILSSKWRIYAKDLKVWAEVICSDSNINWPHNDVKWKIFNSNWKRAVQKNIYWRRFNKKGSTEEISIEPQDYSWFILSLQEWVIRWVKRGEKQELLESVERKHALSKGVAWWIDTKAYFAWENAYGKGELVNSEGAGNNRMVCKGEQNIPLNYRWEFTPQSTKGVKEIKQRWLGILRKIYTKLQGFSSAFCWCSTGVVWENIPSVATSNEPSLQNKGLWKVHDPYLQNGVIEKSEICWGCKQSKHTIEQTTTGQLNKTHKGAFFRKKLYDRFLYSREKLVCRVRWAVSRRGWKDAEKGQNQGRFSEAGMKTDEIQDTTSLQKCWKSWHPDYIISVEKYDSWKEQEVWDIEVENDHSYVCNWFIHHNSNTPNLQNIPRRADEFNIRKAFRPREGYCFVDSDFSQIELRVMAYFAQDENMIKIYQDGGDIHQMVADKVWCSRTQAKSINFGLIYWMSAYGLAQNIKVSKEDAQKFIDAYFENFPAVQIFIQKAINTVKKNKFIQTLTKRRRKFSNYTSSMKDLTKEQQADAIRINRSIERMAVNSTIQWSAADLLKVAMRNMNKRLKEIWAYILLQIHDEVIVECPFWKEEECVAIVKDTMENSVKLTNVPLLAEPKVTDEREK